MSVWKTNYYRHNQRALWQYLYAVLNVDRVLIPIRLGWVPQSLVHDWLFHFAQLSDPGKVLQSQALGKLPLCFQTAGKDWWTPLLCRCKCSLRLKMEHISTVLCVSGQTLSTAMVDAGLTSFSKIEQTHPRELELVSWGCFKKKRPDLKNDVSENVSLQSMQPALFRMFYTYVSITVFFSLDC